MAEPTMTAPASSTEEFGPTLRELLSARLLCMNASEAYHLEQKFASWRLQRTLPTEGHALDTLLTALTGEVTP